MSVRLSYADCNNDGIIQSSSEILEENNYYPFGLKHQGYNDISNSCKSEQAEKYQYNGKEWDDALGLNIYEMDLRQYDPAIGRWTVQDPVIHHEFSPYSAFDNNPAYWADPSGADAVPVSVMDLFNSAEGDITTFTFVNGSLIGTETYMVEELLQNLYELRPLEGTEYEGSKGNAYGGGNGNVGRSGSQPLPIEHQIARQLGWEFGYNWEEQRQIVKWLERHPVIVENGVVRLEGIDGLGVDLNKSSFTVEELTDKIVKAGGKQIFKKVISSLANKTVGGVAGTLLGSQNLNNYPTPLQQEMYRANLETAKMNLINYIFQRDVTIDVPSMLNNMTRTVHINHYSNWDMFYKKF
ncbi:RHS repeat domain-containing protein [Avrilella dinanensis]|uniref:RHS repeat domain-containing protein n=1 Tax=Avrilella dinanensis TaxID=2008672 RepID=UPI00240A7701|nr:RHS repeat-associated core domain-containing protein [Avrilella dinanensis]